jgi:hypothetical protein
VDAITSSARNIQYTLAPDNVSNHCVPKDMLGSEPGAIFGFGTLKL